MDGMIVSDQQFSNQINRAEVIDRIMFLVFVKIRLNVLMFLAFFNFILKLFLECF